MDDLLFELPPKTCRTCRLSPRIPNYTYCRECTRVKNRASYRKHKTTRQAWKKKYQQDNKEILRVKAAASYKKRKAAGKIPWSSQKPNRTRWYVKLKREVFEHYGNGVIACACCGVDESLSFLTLDHVNGDGKAHREELFGKGKPSSGNGIYHRLRKAGYPENIELQILCTTCNLSKSLSGTNTCAHKTLVADLWQSFLDHVNTPASAGSLDVLPPRQLAQAA